MFYAFGKKLKCDTCQCFIDQNCKTHHDCAWIYECAQLDNAWEPNFEPKKEDEHGNQG